MHITDHFLILLGKRIIIECTANFALYPSYWIHLGVQSTMMCLFLFPFVFFFFFWISPHEEFQLIHWTASAVITRSAFCSPGLQ